MHEADRIRLRHMVDAAREAIGYAQSASRATLDRDLMRVRAIVKCVEIIGEAASQVTEVARREMATVPWSAIVAMRNRLVHGYFDVDLDRVWDTVTEDLPSLLELLGPVADPTP